MGAWFDRMFNEHKLVRRFMVFWVIAMISMATWIKFIKYEPTTEDYLGLIGLLSIVIAFYQWSRGREK